MQRVTLTPSLIWSLSDVGSEGKQEVYEYPVLPGHNWCHNIILLNSN